MDDYLVIFNFDHRVIIIQQDICMDAMVDFDGRVDVLLETDYLGFGLVMMKSMQRRVRMRMPSPAGWIGGLLFIRIEGKDTEILAEL